MLNNIKQVISILSLLFFLVSSVVVANDIIPFHSDGCSAYPDGTISQPKKWVQCCIVHDMSYWMGGVAEKKKEADELLKNCVAEETSELHGEFMRIGVTIGGQPLSDKISWRWAYGFSHRKFDKLTEADLLVIYNNLGTIMDDLIANFLDLDEQQKLYITNYYENLLNDFSSLDITNDKRIAFEAKVRQFLESK